MAAIGGSIRELSLNGRVFAPTADASTTTNLGGYSNTTEPNGNLTGRQVKTAMPWSVKGNSVEIDLNRGDMEFLQDIADRFDFVPITITFVDGTTYQGAGLIEGDLEYSNDSASASFDLSGSGKLVQQ